MACRVTLKSVGGPGVNFKGWWARFRESPPLFPGGAGLLRPLIRGRACRPRQLHRRITGITRKPLQAASF